jgi:hypothetical protein
MLHGIDLSSYTLKNITDENGVISIIIEKIGFSQDITF